MKKNIYKKSVPRLTWEINPKERIRGNKKKAAKEEPETCIYDNTKYCDECGDCDVDL